MDAMQGTREVATNETTEAAQPAAGGGKLGLIGGALAAIAASVCWVGPLVLISIGVGGAWMSNLTVLAPYRWLLILLALGFMGYAWHRIYRVQPVAESGCEPDPCAAPQTNRSYRVMFWVVSALVLAAVVSPYLLPLFY